MAIFHCYVSSPEGINEPFSSIFQFTVYSSCLSSINGPFSSIFQFAIYSSCAIFMLFQFAIYSSCGMFIIYKWAIFIHFPVHCLFIMFIINGQFSCIFQFAIYSSCLSSMGHVSSISQFTIFSSMFIIYMGHFHPFSSSLFIHHVYHL